MGIPYILSLCSFVFALNDSIWLNNFFPNTYLLKSVDLFRKKLVQFFNLFRCFKYECAIIKLWLLFPVVRCKQTIRKQRDTLYRFGRLISSTFKMCMKALLKRDKKVTTVQGAKMFYVIKWSVIFFCCHIKALRSVDMTKARVTTIEVTTEKENDAFIFMRYTHTLTAIAHHISFIHFHSCVMYCDSFISCTDKRTKHQIRHSKRGLFTYVT